MDIRYIGKSKSGLTHKVVSSHKLTSVCSSAGAFSTGARPVKLSGVVMDSPAQRAAADKLCPKCFG